jgi:hypothetical protein
VGIHEEPRKKLTAFAAALPVAMAETPVAIAVPFFFLPFRASSLGRDLRPRLPKLSPVRPSIIASRPGTPLPAFTASAFDA